MKKDAIYLKESKEGILWESWREEGQEEMSINDNLKTKQTKHATAKLIVFKMVN